MSEKLRSKCRCNLSMNLYVFIVIIIIGIIAIGGLYYYFSKPIP
ncbi:MAG: hypothetical protein ACP5M8_05180 [Caldisphaera sp.]